MRATLRPLAFLAVAAAAQAANAATITIQVNDPAGQGFNDTTPVAALPTNSGTTRGQQRLNLFNFAAARWAERLQSNVNIVVLADWQGFDAGDCDETGALLGFAGPETFISDFSGAPVAATWYPSALADALSGAETDPGFPDINASFNPRLDTQANCLGGVGWYYGTDNNPGSKVDLLNVLMHEIGHGLGFTGLVDETTGNLGGGQFGIFDRFLYDEASDKFWTQMTSAQRAASATSEGNLVWNGTHVNRGGVVLDAGLNTGHVRMYDPDPVEQGSSVSHFDVSADPDLMMEPFISDGLQNGTGIDLTTCLFRDIGWTVLSPFGCPDFRADVQISVSDTADPVPVSSTFSYNLLVTNNGPAPASNVTVTSSASGATVNVSTVSATQGGCTALPCNLGTIPSGGTATVVLASQASTAVGTATRSASVAADQTDLTASNNSDSEQTTISGDTTPAAFAFVDKTNQPSKVSANSNSITVSGIDTTAPVSVSAAAAVEAKWSKNGGAFQAASGTVVAGDVVRLQVTTASDAGGSVNATLNIGGVTDKWFVTTGTDSTPRAFTVPDLTTTASSTLTSSATVQLTGFNVGVPISVSGTGAKYRILPGGFTTTSGTVQSGQRIALQLTSAAAQGGTASATLTVGGVSDTWVLTTGADTAPGNFNLVDETGAPLNQVRTSNPITVTGTNANAPISISGTGAQYNINGGAYVSTAGTVPPGATVRARLTSAATPGTVRSATLTIGGRSDTWNVTTAP